MDNDLASPRFGLDICLDDHSILGSRRFVLLTNQASVDPSLQHAAELLAEKFPGQLVGLLTPQHGMWGTEQANMIESPDSQHPKLRMPVTSLYSDTRRPSATSLQDAEVLVIDLQDVGTRVYTFVWTATYCLEVAAQAALPVVVLDRPNPIGAVVEGPRLAAGFESFVGRWSLPMRHGLSFGELLLLLNENMNLGAELQVIRVSDWQRAWRFARSQRDWIPPSPNLPTASSCLVYPGQVLLEGTNLSEGRGTTTPFSLVGAPFVDAYRLASCLEDLDLPGVAFRPLQFRPAFDKWQGVICHGVALHVHTPETFRSYRTSVAIISAVRRLWPSQFEWRSPPYEYEFTKPPIDIISGSSRLRGQIESCTDLSDPWLDEVTALDLQKWDVVCGPFRQYE